MAAIEFKTDLKLVEDFAKEYGSTYPSPSPSNSKTEEENTITVEGIDYYLTKEKWCNLYYLLQDESRLDRSLNIEHSEIEKKAHNLHMPKVKRQILDSMEKFCVTAETVLVKPKAGYSSVPFQWEITIKSAFKEDTLSLGNCVYNCIKDLILQNTSKGKLTFENELVVPIVSLFYAVGKNLVLFILYQNKFISQLLMDKKNIDFKNREEMNNLWKVLFDFCWDKDWVTIFKNPEYVKELRSMANKYLEKQYMDTRILQIVIAYILIYGLGQLGRGDIFSLEYEWHVKNLNIPLNELKAKKIWLETNMSYMFTNAGIAVVEHLIKDNIFIFNATRQSKSKPHLAKNFKSAYTVKLNNEILHEMYISSSIFLPFLIKENKEQINIIYHKKNQIIYKSNALKDSIHNNYLNQASYTENSIFVTNPDILLSKFSIDTNFLNWYITRLNLIANTRIENLDDNTRNKAFETLSLYPINFEKLYELANSYEYLVIRNIILDLINFALSFPSEKDNKILNENEILLKKKIIELKTEGKFLSKELINIYYKIVGYKRSLIGTISQAITYSPFRFFIIPSYFDFRGRKYHSGVHLNPQSYQYIKAFVKLYEPLQQIKNKNLLYEKVLDVIENKEIKQKLLEDFPNIIKQSFIEKKIETYFYSYITNISYKDFSQIYQEKPANYDFWLSFMYKRIKDIRKCLSLVSYIGLEILQRTNKSIYYANAYGEDATNSGYQVESMIFKSKSLGKLCNLVGQEKLDIYSELAKEYKIVFTKAMNLMENLLNEFKLTWKDLHERIKENIQFFKINYKYIRINPETSSPLDCFIFLLTTTAINDLDFEILSLCERKLKTFLPLIQYFIKFENEFINLFWILFKGKNILYSRYLKSMFMRCIFICYEITRLHYNLYNYNSWIINNSLLFRRELFKKSVMIQIYGGTLISRKNSMLKYFEEHATNMGISLNYKAIQLLAVHLDNFFRHFSKNRLHETVLLQKVAKLLLKYNSNKPITVINNNFIIELASLKFSKKAKRYSINSSRGYNYRISLNVPLINPLDAKRPDFLQDKHVIYDLASMCSSFQPNFTHSGDAVIVHNFIYTIYRLQKAIAPYEFYSLTNHDTFSVGKFYYIFLKYFVNDSYLTFYKLDYIKSILQNIEPNIQTKILDNCTKPSNPNYLKDSDLININPNFLKPG